MSKAGGVPHHSAAVHDVPEEGALSREGKPFHLEAKGQPLLSPQAFARRFVRFALLATGIITVSLAIGIVGYHYLEHLGWSDSLLNASMILGGMGPVDRPQTLPGKVFASFYALFAGIVFLISVGVLLAPILHRFMHRFHLELDGDDSD
jgi:hypothetical protein